MSSSNEFSDETVRQAFSRAGARCECKRTTHDHNSVRCPRKLILGNRGRDGYGAWEAHHISALGPNTLSNCEILCWPCHEKTF